jgi:Kelch motif
MGGVWEPLGNQPPFSASTMLLLTDGTVLALESNGSQAWRLAPDEYGNYLYGTWHQLASMEHSRLYFASAVLSDGRVFVAGGEYSDTGSDSTDCEIYNPLFNQWSPIIPPAGWSKVGDAPCCVLPDGRLLLGSIESTATAIFDPASDTFTAGPAKHDPSEEETWTLLPDETILSVECEGHPHAEKYVVAANEWVKAGDVPVELVQASSIEIGPAVVLPDGRLFATGATGSTALYTCPASPTEEGSWEPGPTFPDGENGRPLEAKDAPACLLPNGKVLCSVAPAGEGEEYPSGTRFFEYEAGELTEVPAPGNASGPAYAGRMLLLPTGQVLYSNGSNEVSLYTSAGEPEPQWRPQIVECPTHVRRKQTYTLRGRQLNGLSQACSYGDDATMATNYPIVRLRTESGKVFYCRTFDHSTMAIATGSTIESTLFKVPLDAEDGRAALSVIANGISSEEISVVIGEYRLRIPLEPVLVNRLIGSLADGPLWVLGPHGPIPVGPWGPDYERRAREAWDELLGAVHKIEALGSELAKKQAADSAPSSPGAVPRSRGKH